MRKEILNSIIITILLITSVYFVKSGLVEGNRKFNTYYNVTDAAGLTERTSSHWWNPYTNYTGNNTQMPNIRNYSLLFFNFTINNSANVNFNGNITNITITFPTMFQLAKGSGNMSGTGCGGVGFSNSFNMTLLNTTQISLLANSTFGGLSNGTSGHINNNTCVIQLNVTTNGTGNTNTDIMGYININVTAQNLTGPIMNNVSGPATISSIYLLVGVDSAAPDISNVQVTDGIVTQTLGIGTQAITLSNSSNITIYATIKDANLWSNLTVDRYTRPNSGRSNITLWWNTSGSGAVRRGNINANSTNMTNLTSCTWAEAATGCVFYATLPRLGAQQQEGGNLSFIITASDFFEHYSNASAAGGIVGYNITFDNTAIDCEISIPDERFIAYRHYSLSCSGDANFTRLYESNSGVEICNTPNACSGDYSPQQSGILTLECETSDAASNKKTCTRDITVYSRESIYASEGAGTTVPTPTALDISKEAGTTGLSSGQSTTFKYETVDHTIKIDSITSDSVTVTVDGTVSASIGSGQSKELDLTGDGTNDVKITLNRVLLNKADISIEKLAGATVEPQKEVVQEKTTSMAWLWWVLIVIVLAVIIYLVISAKKKK